MKGTKKMKNKTSTK